jgi:hypothetical protein
MHWLLIEFRWRGSIFGVVSLTGLLPFVGAIVAGLLGFLAMPVFVKAKILPAEIRFVVPVAAAAVVFIGGFLFDSWFGPPRDLFD